MALRDQPYLPLYIQDIMTDEKLNECSAATHGIYIKGIMCLMHKSDHYGKILLKQKSKQKGSKEKDFAFQLAKHLPYEEKEIEVALIELITEGVCYYDGDFLCQKRMIQDNELSIKRSEAGKIGGTNSKFAQAKRIATPEYESESKNKIKKKNIAPEFIEFEKYFLDNGYDSELAKRAFNGYAENDWHDSKGNKVLNWKSKCQNVWFREENKKKNEIPHWLGPLN